MARYGLSRPRMPRWRTSGLVASAGVSRRWQVCKSGGQGCLGHRPEDAAEHASQAQQALYWCLSSREYVCAPLLAPCCSALPSRAHRAEECVDSDETPHACQTRLACLGLLAGPGFLDSSVCQAYKADLFEIESPDLSVHTPGSPGADALGQARCSIRYTTRPSRTSSRRVPET